MRIPAATAQFEYFPGVPVVDWNATGVPMLLPRPILGTVVAVTPIETGQTPAYRVKVLVLWSDGRLQWSNPLVWDRREVGRGPWVTL